MFKIKILIQNINPKTLIQSLKLKLKLYILNPNLIP
jgi:hypothetical protein